LALLLPWKNPPDGGGFPTEMLARALKVLKIFAKGDNPHKTSPRQPLISRAMKVALIAELSGLGNDEPRN
jgi:hypothetical protein